MLRPLHATPAQGGGQECPPYTLQGEQDQRPLPGLRFISGTWSSTFPFSSR